MVEVRRQMVRFFGAEETAELLRYRGRTPRGREDLEDLAIYMMHRLPGLKVPEVANQRIDADGWARYLRPALVRFSGLMRDLEWRVGDKEDGTEAKRGAMGAFDRTYRRILRLGKIFYQLAGFEKTARKLGKGGGRPPSQKKKSPRVA